jgi:3'-phosphoadenosine 5'-phosphosulfate sulfotransferase (PAPS reductase)/FAD synthetase
VEGSETVIDFSPILRHQKIALSFSGGKDSLACVYMLRPMKDRITIYHMDTGDLLPEIMEIVDHVKGFWPDFVHIRGDIDRWIEANGMPTDLMPYSQHAVGATMAEGNTKLVARYDCCYSNLMWPTYERIRADGNTLMIRGTKACDMKKLPATSGDNPDGVELFLPIRDWSHADVFAYLRSVGAPIARIYDHVTNSPECARCPAWWGEKRAAYLRKFHPGLFGGYMERMRKVATEIDEPIRNFQREMREAAA